MLVPGAGEPNFDSMVADPYQGAKARREQEVHQLLDKIQPDMITLDPTAVAKVRPRPAWCLHGCARLSSASAQTYMPSRQAGALS